MNLSCQFFIYFPLSLHLNIHIQEHIYTIQELFLNTTVNNPHM